MPTAANNGWMAQTLLMPASRRPHVRDYTVRAYRREALEIDIDFVVHGDGPASSWAVGANVGDPVGLFDEGRMYEPGEGADWQLVVGDESAVPAALAILEQTTDLPSIAFLEVPQADDVLTPPAATNADLRWLPRTDANAVPGRLALAAASEATFPAGRPTVFIAGESALATGPRRHLVSMRGITKADITFVGYWKFGRASIG